MNNVPPICPVCQSPGKGHSTEPAPDGKQAWICTKGHDFIWPYVAPPTANNIATPPCSFEFVLAPAQGFECKVDGYCNFELTVSPTGAPVGGGSVQRHANGQWYVANYSTRLTEAMKHQIEAKMNGWADLE